MKALFLRTHTEDCEKNWKSWESIGHTAVVEQYDNRPHSEHWKIVDLARHVAPDVIVYIGAIERYHGRPVLRPEVLKALRSVAPTVHICGDASDKPWWTWLEQYDRDECFDIQVSIDGNFDTPIAAMTRGVVKLTPTDPAAFPNKPWHERSTFFGMTGGAGHGERQMTLQALHTRAGLVWKRNLPFSEMGAFLGDCKLVVNVPMNGTGDSDHVKGRVIEAGWAGACLLERRNKWTYAWFPHETFLQYDNPDDAIRLVQWARENDAAVQSMAEQFQELVKSHHSPRRFWMDVLAIGGIDYKEP